VLMFGSHVVLAWNVWRMCFGPSATAVQLAPSRSDGTPT